MEEEDDPMYRKRKALEVAKDHLTRGAETHQDKKKRVFLETVINPPKKPEDEEDITILKGHTYGVIACAWSRSGLLASASEDSTARIWGRFQYGPPLAVPLAVVSNHLEGESRKSYTPVVQKLISSIRGLASLWDPGVVAQNDLEGESSNNYAGPQGALPMVLNHLEKGESSNTLTTLEWNVDGKFLATGSYDGQPRIWSEYGSRMKTLKGPKEPVLSLKWNRANLLIGGYIDGTVILWNTDTGEEMSKVKCHSDAVLGVDWLDDITFATCSKDNMICVHTIGHDDPFYTLSGHKEPVNAIKFDPSGIYLGSCSNDRTAKIWRLDDRTLLYDLKKHTKAVHTICWSLVGKDEAVPRLVMASASADMSIFLWNAYDGTCLYRLAPHSGPVHSIAFSPSAEYLASGSEDGSVYIWSTTKWKNIKTVPGHCCIFEVSWNEESNMLAACSSNSTVIVIGMGAN